MKRIVPAVFAACLLASSVAQAKRAMPAKTTICNKSKKKLYVATYAYAGMGSWASQGWRYVKAGACVDFRADAYYVRGKLHVSGLAKRTVKACVTNAKRFYVANPRRGGTLADACKKNKGRLVTFHYTRSTWQSPPTRVTVTK